MQNTTKETVAKAFTADAATLGEPRERFLIPLSVILLVALAIRVVAAFFSKGFAFSDDHFDVIRIAQAWLDGLPLWLNEPMPPRHSMLYVLIHYAIFYVLEAVGVFSPEVKMTVVRLVHALYSLLIVYFGYKLTEKLSNKANARLVGLMLALVWFMPFMSVRNLVEMVCIPPYLAAFYLMVKEDQSEHKRIWPYFWAGVLFALAFVFRYHTVLFGAGAGLVLLYKRQWRAAMAVLSGFAVAAFLVQGTIDIIFFDYPFHSIVAYYQYNSEHANDFSSGPVYRFALTVLGFLVPPVSAFLVVGYARTAKLAPKLFWGGLVFFVAHSLFPNKQERFILPLFPLIMILGVIGWQAFVRNSAFWQNRRKILAWCWGFFWVLNILATVGMAFTYTKKSRVAPLVYLSEKPDFDGVVLEFGNHSVKNPPLFYLGRMSAIYEGYTGNDDMVWQDYLQGKKQLPENFVMTYTFNEDKTPQLLQKQVRTSPYKPDYIVVVGTDDMEERMARLHQVFPNLQLDHTITPSLYDQLLHLLNPRVHKDEHVQIYEVVE
ncbi:4-amino-4-deoxy-L-arabinose transferase-like glycosyltransferase [Pontibacter ummariensis]|uniref:4-amino-4-deoxy-L-arabinose transferase n=1 Tax=Pontibacter ummariensis TaxID=1610492 RepID=A0A239HRA1_9BACT|nr:glycosyltransferase family 39 protein [Pontibacter ummariensis]PRY10385.1 4-amino-4-deoxy-L-arabinose transferase-like glycosyltransferase [Pontibacter ummariensis]SNS83608.1 4-amino-4-deoxy-L-arabinose transferase [Pontibacter ummariensis]